MSSPTPKMSAAEAEFLRKSKVCSAYREVFGGDPKQRTEAQAIVWADLQKVGYTKSPVFLPDKTGAICPLRAAHADGRRWAWLYVEANVEFDPQQQQQLNQEKP